MTTFLKNSALIFSFLILINKVEAQKFTQSIDFSNNVINSFKQGNDGDFNCASIAFIKCAIATFGIDEVLKNISEVGDAYNVTLRNNEIVSISKKEVDSAKSHCGFVLIGDEKIFDKAVFLYAILAKKAINNSNNVFSSCKDFQSALFFIHGDTGGVDAINFPALLGLQYRADIKFKSQISYVHENGYHAVFASYEIFDDYGLRHKFNIKNWMKHIGGNLSRDLSKTNFVLLDQ